MLRKITAKNLLSFGPSGVSIDLQRLNVLIGANGSGKSNLIEAIGLFQAAPRHQAAPVREGGGVRNWIWKGRPDATASLEAVIENPNGSQPIRHVIEFKESAQRFTLADERVENEQPNPGENDVYFYYRFQDGHPALNVKAGGRRQLQRDTVVYDESILSQRKDPDQFPELSYLGEFYESIKLYREWEFGPNAVIRQAQRSDTRPSPLAEDFSNLGMFLNRLRQYPTTKAKFFEKLNDIYDGITDFELNFEGGTVQVFFTEGEFAIPANRLSDGSLRYLCLLAILLDPEPPPLIAIEEPEVGLHPDLMHKLADLLLDASNRCQLVVTTHSDILIDALTEHPESVVVCEKRDGQTVMQRLDRDELTPWLEKYRLGQLWTAGEFGGVRW